MVPKEPAIRDQEAVQPDVAADGSRELRSRGPPLNAYSLDGRSRAARGVRRVHNTRPFSEQEGARVCGSQPGPILTKTKAALPTLTKAQLSAYT